VVVLLVAAVIGGVYALNRPGGEDPGSASTPFPTPSSLPTVTFTPSPSQSPSGTPSPSKAAKPLPRVAPSVPRRFEVAGLINVGFDDVVAPRNGIFSAASTAEVARWGGRGIPGSPTDDTVYVIGKVSAGGAFAKLPQVHRGTRITLRTRNGALTYTVQAATERSAKGLTKDDTFTARYVGRLQLVGIRYDADGDRTGKILVVTAQLTAARPT
jgi:hypothetical protein